MNSECATCMNAEVVHPSLEVGDIWTDLLLLCTYIHTYIQYFHRRRSKRRENKSPRANLVVHLLGKKAHQHPKSRLHLLGHGQHIGAQSGEVLLHRSSSHLYNVLG